MVVKTAVTLAPRSKMNLVILDIYEIVSQIEKYNIPHSMIINIDQTPLKYVSTTNYTLAKKGSTTVTVEGGNDKRTITGTFGIYFTNKFLPIQLIYGGKTDQSLPRFKFPEGFSTSVNPTHYSNTEEYYYTGSIITTTQEIVDFENLENDRLREPYG